MSSLKASIWAEAPPFETPEVPARLCDTTNLWLSYRVAQTKRYAIVRFEDVIDHRLSPINDEGIGKHPCFKAGLHFYDFNEVTGSQETIQWAVLKARHWVVTFKDTTLDVVATEARVVARDLQASNPTSALLEYLREPAKAAGSS